MCVSISENLSTFDVLTNSPYNGFDYTHHIAMTYCIDIISDSEKEISEYVNDRSGSVENDSLGYKWISIDSFCEKNASPLVIKVCELINNKKSPIQDDYIEKYLAEKELDLTATLDAKTAYADADFVVIAY